MGQHRKQVWPGIRGGNCFLIKEVKLKEKKGFGQFPGFKPPDETMHDDAPTDITGRILSGKGRGLTTYPM